MHQVQLWKPLRAWIDHDSLDLKNLKMLHRFALHNNVWNGTYLISKYKDQEHVFLWYKTCTKMHHFKLSSENVVNKLKKLTFALSLCGIKNCSTE